MAHDTRGNGERDKPAADEAVLSARLRRLGEVGAAIGWLIDRVVGISPWGMIVFLLLGFVAGVLNVMRTAGVIPASKLDPPVSRQ